MARKVLIANRGEIARRVIRACRKLNLRSVAVYSEADAGMPFVEEADEAVLIGPASPRESYLQAAKIIEVLKDTGANSVHPGYGFFSESAEFAEHVRAAGAIWIGPAPETIRAMGDKQRARGIAMAAGVPVVPGSERFPEGDLDGIEAAAEEVGFPLLVKAAAGGGGIGMKLVADAGDLVSTVEATQSMAGKAFGDGAVFMERFIPRARHVEMQVFGFGNGNGVHFYERDCSLQRRYQKMIEESPAPGLSDETRTSMQAAAIALVRHTDYAGAGTVEFLVDATTQEFYFLEMNTRIQVEHPVTEMVTGVDLVAMQIDLAYGRPLEIHQDTISTEGASIECRLYAENPKKRFFPSPGPLRRLRFPEETENLRIEAAYREGNDVTQYYDPMIAKVVVRGVDRREAIDRAIAALSHTVVEGTTTNRDFLIACLRNHDFVAGDVHTAFIEHNLDHLLSATET